MTLTLFYPYKIRMTLKKKGTSIYSFILKKKLRMVRVKTRSSEKPYKTDTCPFVDEKLETPRLWPLLYSYVSGVWTELSKTNYSVRSPLTLGGRILKGKDIIFKENPETNVMTSSLNPHSPIRSPFSRLSTRRLLVRDCHTLPSSASLCVRRDWERTTLNVHPRSFVTTDYRL